MEIKRVFLIVLDSCGAGEMPDAAEFGDFDVNTIKSLSRSEKFSIENLRRLGYGNIDGLGFLGAVEKPLGAVARLAEASQGKDTTTGHWEICGIVSDSPLPTYPEGFPPEVIEEFEKATGRGVLCNLPYSGTQVIHDYGREHLESGKLIVYTSADSVFQIAAHEDIVPVEELYSYCRTAREILVGKHGVGRVIARPFHGEWPMFVRSAGRHDYSLLPPTETLLDALKNGGFDTVSIGKISDIFAGRGVSESIPTKNNDEGMAVLDEVANREFKGLCFANLVDFDMVYGHRRNVDGYAKALADFDGWLGGFMKKLGEGDVLIVTADHGCDPAYTRTTDHTREYVPLMICGDKIAPINLGTRASFADIGATVAEWFGVELDTKGKSFAREVTK